MVILRVLKLALEPILPGRQPILSFDCAPIHLQPAAIQLLGELDIWWLLVPKKHTWLFQPLDTHAFMRYKRFIRKQWMDRLIEAAGRRNVYDVVQIVIGAIRFVLQGIKWNHAFLQNGLAEDMKTTSKYILDQLQWKELPLIVPQAPDADMLAQAWPTSRRVPLIEIYTSLGLEPPGPIPYIAGMAPADSILAPLDENDIEDDASDYPEDTAIPPVPPLSDDDMPLVPA